MVKTDLDHVLRPFAHLVKSGGADRVAVLMLADALEDNKVDAPLIDYVRRSVWSMKSDPVTKDGKYSLGWCAGTFQHGDEIQSRKLRHGIVTRMEEILREDGQ